MKIFIAAISLLCMLIIAGCQKSMQGIAGGDNSSVQIPDDSAPANNILVDASKDGGTWWFPQGTSDFSISDDHQGKALADYLRSLGYHVDELSRGAVITDSLLANYSKIIRSPAFSDYTAEELNAYKNFMNRSGAILLFQDHLSYDANDKLSAFLGLDFEGAIDGDVTIFGNNAITNNIDPFYYIAGAVVTNAENNPNITVLGSISKANYTVLNNADPFHGQTPDNDLPVMGVVNNFPNTKIFFLGDENCMESVPQPLTQNIVNWLFK